MTLMRNSLLFILVLPLFAIGQIISPSLTSNSGDSYSNSKINMDFSIGEVVIETYQNNEILSQGFHQALLIVQTGVSELDFLTKVYPNPTTNIVVVELEKDITGDIILYDINGRLMLRNKLENERIKYVDFSKLNQGNYLLQLNINNKKNIYKIQKIK